MLQSFVDDHLVADQISMPATEEVELIAIADQFDTDRQMRIGNFRAVLPDRFVIAEAVIGILRDGVDDAVRLRGANQLAIERLCPPEATRADLVGRFQIDAQHPDFAVMDGETIGRDGLSTGNRIRRACAGEKRGACGHRAGSRRV